MRAVIQRVSQARVDVDGSTVGEIGAGLVVLVGVGAGDGAEDADYLSDKIANLRVFADDDGRMSRSVIETSGSILIVSQFTLYGDVRRGRRPSYSDAAAPDMAKSLYEHFVGRMRSTGIRVETGVFQAMMEVSLTNDGPVTVLIDSKKQF